MSLLPEACGCAWWTGVAASGKSTLTKLLGSLSSKPTAWSLSELTTPFGLEGILHSSCITVDEVKNNGEIPAEETFKSLVTGEFMTVARKHKPPLVQYQNRASLYVCSNYPPFVKDKSTEGTWRRLTCLDWPTEIPEDQRIKNFHKIILAKEGEVFLDWMLEGLSRLMRRGGQLPYGNDRPLAVRELTEDLRDGQDSVRSWAMAVSLKQTSSYTKTHADVYASYLDFCTRRVLEPLEKPVLFRQLKASRRWNGKFTQTKPAGWMGTGRPNFLALEWGDDTTGVNPQFLGFPKAATPVSTPMTPTERDAMLMNTGRKVETCSEEDFMFPEIPVAAGGKE
jgi:phage/plasmid-associated DNA primase